MNQNTLGVLAGVCLSLCAAATAHADTVKMIDTSPILNVELTPNERTSVLFDANARPHIPSNPTTGTLIVLVEVGPLFNADEHAPAVNAQLASNSPHDNVPVAPPMSANVGGSNTVLMLAALGLIRQPQESSVPAPAFQNPLPPTFVLFGTTLVGLCVLARRRRKRLSA